MSHFILQRTFIMVLTMLVLSFVVFYLGNLEPNLRKLALEQNNNRMSQADVDSWLEKNGYRRSFIVRYGEWTAGVLSGDFGYSTRFRMPVNEALPKRLGYTGILAFWVLMTMVPSALLIGILSGMLSPGPIPLLVLCHYNCHSGICERDSFYRHLCFTSGLV